MKKLNEAKPSGQAFVLPILAALVVIVAGVSVVAANAASDQRGLPPEQQQRMEAIKTKGPAASLTVLPVRLFEWRHGEIDAVVSVGPLECMPTKIAEAQLQHVAERDRLFSLTLAFNGDPVSTATLDNFAFEVKERFKTKRGLVGYERYLQTQ